MTRVYAPRQVDGPLRFVPCDMQVVLTALRCPELRDLAQRFDWEYLTPAWFWPTTIWANPVQILARS